MPIDSEEEVKLKVALATGGLRKVVDAAEDLDDITDEELEAIDKARESAGNALRLLEAGEMDSKEAVDQLPDETEL